MNSTNKVSERRKYTRLSISGLLLIAVLVGCQDQSTSARPFYLDAQSASIDGNSPYTLFDGRGGSLLLSEGWGRREGDGGSADGGSYAWSIADEVKVLFPPPDPGEYDFYARVNPLLRPGNTGEEPLPQTIELLLDDDSVGSVTLSASWQSIRVPLPRFGKNTRLQQLAIRFGYTTRPKDIGLGLDERELAVSFSEAAIIPRDIEDAQAYVASLESRLQDDGVTLSARTPWKIPLPVDSRVVLDFDAIDSNCKSCLLTASVEEPDGTRELLWSGTTEEAPDQGIAVTTDGGGIDILRISLDAGCEGCDGDSGAKLNVGADFLRTMRNQSARRPPHVFIYAIDTLRADALEPYGAAVGSSPKIAQFAGDAVVYSNSRAASAWTLPSTVSLLTGVHADRHGVMKGDAKFSEDRARSLPRLLSERGYQSVGISQSYVVSGAFGLAEPFDSFLFNDHVNSFALRSQRVRRFLIEWLRSERNGESPIFAYFHTVDPHSPYEPVDPFRKAAKEHPGKLDQQEYLPTVFRQNGHLEDAVEVRHLKALYEGEVLYADAEFGRFVDLLKELNLYEDSMIVLVSDHGEEFGEHGGVEHMRSVYDELLRVPLIVKYPQSLGAGTTSDVLASTVDVAPTVLQLADQPTADMDLDGRTLPPVSASSGSNIAFAHLDVEPGKTAGPVNYSVYIRDSLKCIHGPSGQDQFRHAIPVWQAFDLADDPNELRPMDATSCAALAAAWAQDRSNAAAAVESDEVSKKSLERLRSLGYIQ